MEDGLVFQMRMQITKENVMINQIQTFPVYYF